MKQPILHLTAIEPLDDDYDPMLGRTIATDLIVETESSGPQSNQGSVFDDPELDFAYEAIVPEVFSAANAAVSDDLSYEPHNDEALSLSVTEEAETMAEELVQPDLPDAELESEPESIADTEPEPLIGTEPEPVSEQGTELEHEAALLARSETVLVFEAVTEPEPQILEGTETIPELYPETEAEAEAAREGAARSETVAEAELELEPEPLAAQEPDETVAKKMSWQDINNLFNPRSSAPSSLDNSTKLEEISEQIPKPIKPRISFTIEEPVVPPIEENVQIEPLLPQETVAILEESALPQDSDSVETIEPQNISDHGDIFSELGARPKTTPSKLRKKKKRKAKKINSLVLFGGILTTGSAALMSFFAMLEMLGPPFDLIAQLRWYWVLTAIVGTLIWGLGRQWLFVVISAIVASTNFYVIHSTLGLPPIGGQPKATIGYGNIGGNQANLNQLLSEAEAKHADVLLISGVGNVPIGAPANWSILINAAPNDSSAFTILAKSGWSASAQTGEPIIVKPADNWFTLVGLNPIPPSKRGRENPDRDSVINRAANRAGAEEVPVLVIGDFEVPSWVKHLTLFAQNGDLTRVRCGGILASNYDNGILGFSADHAFSRGLNVSSCAVGAKIGNSKRHSMWVAVAPAGN
ncbi:MAG: protein product from transcript [Hyphomonadaceae bacterium]|nr:MAG: protein product from transcript [Hyphomonadaceae bacterium]KAF0186005.1 MAG: protein product from transcript [Hyphomonadaceae bacterium]